MFLGLIAKFFLLFCGNKDKFVTKLQVNSLQLISHIYWLQFDQHGFTTNRRILAVLVNVHTVFAGL